MESGTTNVKTAACPRKIPADVRILGKLGVVAGAIGVVIGLGWILGLFRHDFAAREILTLFGALRVRSPLGLGVSQGVRSLVGVIIGFGYLRGRPWAWWLALLYLVEAIPGNVILAPQRVGWAVFAFSCMALKAGWLTYRFRFFKPLGGKTRPRTDAGVTG